MACPRSKKVNEFETLDKKFGHIYKMVARNKVFYFFYLLINNFNLNFKFNPNTIHETEIEKIELK